jgi:HNH endonuclease/AP2 domain
MFSETKLRLSAERLREALDYRPETGLFYWRVSHGSASTGLQAGTQHDCGYSRICVDGVRYYAHSLAWLHVYGEYPIGEIDHKNRNPADNRIANLRQCSHAQNMCNATRRNPSGFKGVSRARSKWRATIGVNGRSIHLGTFSTPEEAAAAYDKAARLYHREFARTNEMLGLLPPQTGPGQSPGCVRVPDAVQRGSGFDAQTAATTAALRCARDTQGRNPPAAVYNAPPLTIMRPNRAPRGGAPSPRPGEARWHPCLPKPLPSRPSAIAGCAAGSTRPTAWASFCMSTAPTGMSKWAPSLTC